VVAPSVFWVVLDQVDLSPTAAVRRVDVAAMQRRGRAGEITDLFDDAPPFPFAPVTV
jgi:hypothetical protein